MRITWSIKLGALTGLLFSCLNSFAQSSLLDSLINRQQIKQTVEYLASDSLQGRFTGTKAALAAANFIAAEFRKAGVQTLDSTNGYLYSFNIAGPEKIIGYNVVGILPGSEKPAELILFSAHYDHVGTLSTNPYHSYSKRFRKKSTDSIFNGANDNASGTSALISLARYFGFSKSNKRTIILVAFAGEELGLLGSTALAKSLKNPASVTCMINLEMLGRGHSPFITGSELGNLRDILNKELAKTDKKIYTPKYFGTEQYPEQKLFMRSDNYPFAQLRIPAHTIMAGSDLDDYYHTVDDEPSTLNYELIRTIAIAVAIAVRPIINGEVKLQRIDPANYKALFQGN
jgi:Zn-dependent M28 family amino/carboxypeptidase